MFTTNRETAQKAGKPEPTRSNGNGKVNINGKEYLTVAYRMAAFRQQYPAGSGWTIKTKCIHQDNDKVIFQATIKTPEGKVVATGHAEEKRNDSFINRTAAFENCETSAIGRALASAGFIGSEFASADEVAMSIKAQTAQETSLPTVPKPETQTAPKAVLPSQAKPEPQAKPAKPAQAETSLAEAKLQGEPGLALPKTQSSKPGEDKAELWAKEHLAQWLDSTCPFEKALGRTWRELAENKGDKILIKGQLFPPRAYLHAVASWQAGQVWPRVKAKIALEVIPSNNGNHSQPVEATK